MNSREDLELTEQDIQRRWHEAHLDRFLGETDPATRDWRVQNIAPHADEGRAFLEELRRTRDLGGVSGFDGSLGKKFQVRLRGYCGSNDY